MQLDRRQGLESDAAHHRFKVIPDLPRQSKTFDDGSGAKQREDADIVE
jgi:hypothetical protein